MENQQQQQQQVNININPFDYPEVKCDNCGCSIFSPGVMLRKIPGTLVGNAGQNVFIDQRVMYCVNCHELSPVDKEMLDKASKKPNDNEPQTSSIIV